MTDTFRTIRYAFRTMRRSLGVTVLATASLALAIAGNVIVFSLTNGLLFRPLPYAEPERLTFIGERAQDQPAGFIAPTSAANYLDWRGEQTSFSDVGALRGQPLGLDRGERVEQVDGAAVTPSFFTALGVDASKGRVFLPEEGVPGRDKVVVLGHAFFAERYGDGADVLGETLELNGEPHTVVGVMPEDFEFLDPSLKIYVPLALDAAKLRRHQRDLLVVARLAPGVSEQAAQDEMAAIMARLAKAYPEANGGMTVDVLNLRHEVPDSRNRIFFAMMQGAMLFVLLIACANIANLLLARGQRREREMAVRSSLGASRGQLATQLFLESLVMASIAGAIGLAIGKFGNDLVARAFSGQLPKFYAPVIDHRVIAATLAVTFFGGFLFSLAPMLQTFRSDLLGALKDGSKSSASGRKKWMSSALVVGELALALVFLAGAAVLLRSFQVLQTTDPGFDTSNLLTMGVTLPESTYQTPEEQARAVQQLEERLASLPAVEASLASSTLPRHIFVPRDIFSIDGEPQAPDASPLRSDWLTTDTGYFQTLGIDLHRGRLFTEADRLGSEAVAVVNEAMAKTYFGDSEAVGRSLTVQGASRTIVGVVEDVRHGLSINDEQTTVIYLPFEQLPSPALALALRVEGVDPMTLAESVRREVRAFDPHLGLSEIQTLDAFIDQFWSGQRVFTVILRAFGGLALLLAALGTYGVLAYAVAQRRQEIGVRMAIGADRRTVVGMILRQGLILAALGFTLGLPGIWLVNRGLQAVMDSFAPVEMGPVLLGGGVLLGVTLLASLLPALRASGIDPATALREE